MKIEEGKFYKTRDGRKATVSTLGCVYDVGKVLIDEEFVGFVFISTGMANYDAWQHPTALDLIEEWKEEVMEPKFAVGDHIRYKLNNSFAHEWQDVIVTKLDKYGIWGNNDLGVEGLFNESEIELIKPKSPVVERNVTVKEIVAGCYANFCIGATDSMNRIHVIQGDNEMFSAQELRQAAVVFNQLADYLEEEK